MSKIVEKTLLGRVIAKKREVMGLSQIQLAEKAGISSGTLASIESGHSQEPSVMTLSALSTGLELSFTLLADLVRCELTAEQQAEVDAILSAQADTVESLRAEVERLRGEMEQVLYCAELAIGHVKDAYPRGGEAVDGIEGVIQAGNRALSTTPAEPTITLAEARKQLQPWREALGFYTWAHDDETDGDWNERMDHKRGDTAQAALAAAPAWLKEG